MATAEELLARLANPATEPHIVIGADRVIEVPDELKRIAVQFDHNIETVTFDCPRYWDGNDMSKMKIYINYKTPDNRVGSYHSDEVTVDTSDTNIMHFTWTISKNVTSVKGTLSFLVCIKKTDASGNEINHWNSELNREMTISEGLECAETILDDYPDIITHILTRLSTLEALGGIDENAKLLELDPTLSIAGRAADAKAVGDELKELEDAIATVRMNLTEYEIDLTESVIVDSDSSEKQTFNVVSLVNGATLKNAIDEGRTIYLTYTDPDKLFGNNSTARVMLSTMRRYTADSVDAYIITLSGVVLGTGGERFAEIKLMISGEANTVDGVEVVYTPDKNISTGSDGSGGASGNNINFHVISVGSLEELNGFDFTQFAVGDVVLVAGLEELNQQEGMN